MSSERCTWPGMLWVIGLAGLIGLGAAPGPAAGADRGASPSPDPWTVLAKVRDRLRSESPLAAAFDQSFVPSGFSTGDTESGTLYVDLPKCLRFEYREPFPKNFLLCGDWVYTWNPGEASGRRFLVEDGEAEGIDLLRLEVESLRRRYRAELAGGDAGTESIRLIPTGDGTEIRQASVELARHDPAAADRDWRLVALSYEDRSGNRTRFEIGESTKLETGTEFTPPKLEWLDD